MGIEVEDSMTTMDERSRFKRSKFKNSSSFPAGKKGGKGQRSSTMVGGLKSKSEILKKRNIKQIQERRRKVKRKMSATKGQGTKRRK